MFTFVVLQLFLGNIATATTDVGARFTCSVPELSQMVEAISQSRVPCPSLLKKGIDPHHVEFTPSMIQSLKSTDVLITVGLGLEDEWLQKALLGSGSNVQWNSNSHVVLGPKLNPRREANEHGHHGFDPHVMLSPIRVTQLIAELGRELSQRGCEACLLQSQILADKFRLKTLAWAEKLKKGPSQIASYHGAFDYFLEDFGIKSEVKIEDPKKGAPTLKQLLILGEKLKSKNIKVILMEPSAPEAIGSKLKELVADLKIIPLPTGLTNQRAENLEQLFDLYVSELTK